MPATVTAATLARHFGVTSRGIGDLVCRKVIERRGNGLNLEDSTRRSMRRSPPSLKSNRRRFRRA
jgi:hypothetical protein